MQKYQNSVNQHATQLAAAEASMSALPRELVVDDWLRVQVEGSPATVPMLMDVRRRVDACMLAMVERCVGSTAGGAGSQQQQVAPTDVPFLISCIVSLFRAQVVPEAGAKPSKNKKKKNKANRGGGGGGGGSSRYGGDGGGGGQRGGGRYFDGLSGSGGGRDY
jgi:uncharacterized membrane protein YgcG